MAIIKTTKKDKTEKKTTNSWTDVLKKVPIRVIGSQGYMLINVDRPEIVKQLEAAPVDVTVQDGVVLFNLSRFCRAALEGVETDVNTLAVKGYANVKLRLADYDYTYKGKKGHTSKLEVIGMAIIKSTPISDALEDLMVDEDEADVDLDDLPF